MYYEKAYKYVLNVIKGDEVDIPNYLKKKYFLTNNHVAVIK